MPQPETQTLTDDEKDVLTDIYKKRRQVFLFAYLWILVVGIFLSFYKVNPGWSKKKDGDYVVSKAGMIGINALFIEAPLFIIGAIIYRKRIYAYKKDVQTGLKILVPYEVVRKEMFPEVNEYYLSFDDPDYMHYAVDETTFYKYNVGDTVYVSRAAISGYAFDNNRAFSLM